GRGAGRERPAQRAGALPRRQGRTMRERRRTHFGDTELPEHLQSALRRARRLEWFTLAFVASAVVLVYLVMGGSQAMKAAWLEDMLSLIPPIAFLVGARFAQVRP